MPTPSRQGNAPGSSSPKVQYVQVERERPRTRLTRSGLRTEQNTYTKDSSGNLTRRVTSEPRQVKIPSALPNFLGNRTVLVAAWAISMVVVGVDDWRNNNIMPRPSRLWAVSLFFFLLALASIVDAIVPIVNALAIGYTLMLIWNYFTKAGQFA